MKFTILSILGVSAFRISGVSADCCQTSETSCPQGYGNIGISLGGNIVCGVKVDGTTSCGNIDSSMAFCSGGDVPAPTPPTSGVSAECCLTSGSSCPEGYEMTPSIIDGKNMCVVKIDGNINCSGIDSSSMESFCSGGDAPTATPPTPAPPTPAPPTSSSCSEALGVCVCSGQCPSFTSGWSTDFSYVNGVATCVASKSGNYSSSGTPVTTATVDGKAYQSPFESCDGGSSSAGKIGMNVWFVAAAAAAFAGTN